MLGLLNAALLLSGTLLVLFHHPVECRQPSTNRNNNSDNRRRPSISAPSFLRSNGKNDGKKVASFFGRRSAAEATAATKTETKAKSSSASAGGGGNAFYRLPKAFRYCISGSLGNVALFLCEDWVAKAIRVLAAATETTTAANAVAGTAGAKIEDENVIGKAASAAIEAGMGAAAAAGEVASSNENDNEATTLLSIVVKYQESFSFFLGYLLHVPVQHLLHAVLVYGLQTLNTPKKYLYTLLGTYSAFSISLVGSTALNTLLRQNTDLDKNVAFAATIILFAGFNYFALGWIVSRVAPSSSSSSSSLCGDRKNRNSSGTKANERNRRRK